jgi:hypothetical protein
MTITTGSRLGPYEVLSPQREADTGRPGTAVRRPGGFHCAGARPRSTRPLWDLQPDVDSQGRVVWRNGERRGVIYDPETKQTQVLKDCVGESFRWSPDDQRIAYMGTPESPEAGLWISDFRSPPRQIFRGWVVHFAWIRPDELVFAEGRPDLRALLWRVRADGSRRERIPATLPTAGMYWKLLPGSGPSNVLDLSPDGRFLVFRALEQSEADIGMIENVR